MIKKTILKKKNLLISVDIIIPFSIFYCLETYHIPITTSEIMEVSKASREDIRAFTYEGLNFFPKYAKRDRKVGILQTLNELSNSLNLGPDFFKLSNKLLCKLWNLLKESKKNVIAGVIAAITSLCFFKGNIRINSITEELGLGSSTNQKAVKTKIINRFNISGFKGIVRSSELLREVLEKLNIKKLEEGLITPERDQIEIEPPIVSYREPTKDESIEDITLITLKDSNGFPIISSNENKIVFLAFHDRTGKPIYLGIRSYERSYIFRNNNGEYLSHRKGYKLEILHGYFPRKDPPY